MTAALKWKLISVENYLAGELLSPIKHEYLGGVVHAMAGARVGHNVIKGNIFAALHARLRGKPCRPYDSDNKLRLQVDGQTRFYYPDVMVSCQPQSPTDAYLTEPTIVFEVLSKSTRRIDLGEKKDAYLKSPSLQAYVLVEQEAPIAIVFRRTPEGFVREVHEGLDTIVRLPEIEAELPLAEVYEGVEFIPEPGDDDDA